MSRSRITIYAFLSTALGSLGLVLGGEIEAMFAWWLVIMLLLPPTLWAFSTTYTSLKIFCLTSFGTQYLTLPFFFLYRDNWQLADVKPFGFTALETLPILLKVSLFLCALVLFFKLIYRLSWRQKTLRKSTHTRRSSGLFKRVTELGSIASFDLKNNVNSAKTSGLIAFLIPLLIVLNLWQYSQGIGITGVDPPRLPYRMAGILFYFTKFLIPVLLGYLYLKTKRGWPLMLLYLVYAWVFGLCSTSKGAVIMVMAPVIALAWVDKRYGMLVVSFLGAMLGVFVASGARYYVHTVTNGVTGADTSLGLFTLIGNVFLEPSSKIWDFDFLPWIVVGIAGRIEAFGSLVQAQYYDPDAVVGAWGFIFRMVWTGLVEIDVDAHHIQWQGNTLPVGFYNGGSILSNAVIVGNSGLLWVVISALITAAMLVVVEKNTNSFVKKYVQLDVLRVPIIFYMTVLYFTHSSTSGQLIFILIAIALGRWLPFRPIRFGLRMRSRAN
jgi:hypothetical protein